jgi:hypothetical protein
VENFSQDKSILVKTRRVRAYLKLSKFNYTDMLLISLVNDNAVSKYFNSYKHYLSNDLLRNIWKFFSNLVPKHLGLVSSNHHKSILLSVVSKSTHLKTIKINSYLKHFEVYHFYAKKDIFKKLTIFFLATVGVSQVPHNINFNIYNGYLWLSWYLKLNPMNNIFYLKVYNY